MLLDLSCRLTADRLFGVFSSANILRMNNLIEVGRKPFLVVRQS